MLKSDPSLTEGKKGTYASNKCVNQRLAERIPKGELTALKKEKK